jgi:hypothetical protein
MLLRYLAVLGRHEGEICLEGEVILCNYSISTDICIKLTVENLQNLKRKGYTEGLDQLEHTPDIAGIEVRFIF